MSTRDRARRGSAPEGALLLGSVVGVLAVAALAYGCWVAGDALAGVDQAVPLNPITAALALGRGELVWPVEATVLGGVVVVLAAAVAVAVLVLRPRRGAVDHVARNMARPGDLSEVTGRSARDKAARLLPAADTTDPTEVGLLVGRTVNGGAPLYLSWEDVGTVLAGPRMGKTHAVAIPAICSAPGAVVATSNKADLHHHTRLVREQRARAGGRKHGRVWVSDLQGIAGEPGQDWWWNPLAGVTSLAPARVLAGYFIDASTTQDTAGTGGYFEGGAQELLALHILAAACVKGDLLHVLGWLSHDNSPVPARLLEQHGHELPAMAMRKTRGLNPRQRDGLFDMARAYLRPLGEPVYAAAVTPPRRQPLDHMQELGAEVQVHDRPELDPVTFATSRDTLYALSKEGRSSSSALTTALVGRIFDAAQSHARRSPAGRLEVPLVAVLDEAANICKLTELPDQYSHFGSQGIVVLTVLQSPAQARKVWTEDQFAALLSASNVHYYGGGITDDRYLESLSHQVGDHDVSRWSASHGRGDRTRSQSWSREAIMPVQALAAMPKDRALVMTSGNPPVLIRKTFWQDGPHAAAIHSSLRTYESSVRNPLLTPQAGAR